MDSTLKKSLQGPGFPEGASAGHDRGAMSSLYHPLVSQGSTSSLYGSLDAVVPVTAYGSPEVVGLGSYGGRIAIGSSRPYSVGLGQLRHVSGYSSGPLEVESGALGGGERKGGGQGPSEAGWAEVVRRVCQAVGECGCPPSVRRALISAAWCRRQAGGRDAADSSCERGGR